MIDSTILLLVIIFCTALVATGLMNWHKKFTYLNWISKLRFELKGKWLVLIAVVFFLIYLLVFQYFIGKTFKLIN